jgi:transposase-like protein
MARQTSLTDAQKQQIVELTAQGVAGRKIADRIGVSYAAVRNHLEKSKGVSPETHGKVIEVSGWGTADLEKGRLTTPAGNTLIFSNAVGPAHSVFEVRTGLEWLQQQLGTLFEEAATLRDKLFVLNQLQQLSAEATAVLESIHNIELLDAFIQEVTAILEEQIPEVRERLYRKLEACGMGTGVNPLEANPSE